MKMSPNTSELCSVNGRICVGCCMQAQALYTRSVKRDLCSSTASYNACLQVVKNKNQNPSQVMKSFGTRLNVYVLPSGLCPNLVKKGKHVLCAVHPANNQGHECRPDYPSCYKEYLCETAQHFNRWSNEKKQAFAAFLLGQRVSWHRYGVNMDNGTWLAAFQTKKA